MRRPSYTLLTLIAFGLAALTLTGCDEEPPIGPSPGPCTYALSTSRQLFTNDGGSAVVTVTTASHCSWTASTSASWIAMQGVTSGVGTGTIGVVVAANSGDQPRAGTIAVADQTITLSQEARTPCAFDVSPSKATYVADGGSGKLHVTTTAACAWTAETSDAWMKITDGAQGQGEGDVTYTVAKNEETSDRSGTITAAGQSVRIEQAAASPPSPPLACEYSASPVEFVLHWHHTGGEINLATTAGCTWSVTPGADWMSVTTPAAGAGSGVIRFAQSIYTEDGNRRAPVQVRWPTPTAGQNVWVTQEGCRYGISETSRDVAGTGGTVDMYVVTQAVSASCAIDCPWTATALVPWIHIVTSMPHAGDDRLRYLVDPNTTGQARVGQIRIQNQTVTVRQTGLAEVSQSSRRP